MNVTEVKIKLADDSDGDNPRLVAYASIVLDNMFCTRDLKVIDGPQGLFVAMPSRKIMDHCQTCGCKNALRARFCNGCARRLGERQPPTGADGRYKLHADIAHPINAECRAMIQSAVLTAYERERLLAESPGYVCRYYDDDDEAMVARAYPR